MKFYQHKDIEFPHTYHEWSETRLKPYNGIIKVSLSVFLSTFGIKKILDVTDYCIQYHESDVRKMLIEETNKLLKNYTVQVCALTYKLQDLVGPQDWRVSPDLLIYGPLGSEWFILKTLNDKFALVMDNGNPKELSWSQIINMRIYNKQTDITTTLKRFW